MPTKTAATKKPAAKAATKKTPAAKTAATKKPAAAKAVTKKPVVKTAVKTAATKKSAATKATTTSDPAVAAAIEQRFAAIGDWRGATLARLRALILEADPELLEERKWIKPSNPHGVPTYSRGGLVLTLEVYKEYVKLTFAAGSKVPDPTGIFNASLLGVRRAIDIRAGESVDASAFKTLVRAAVEVNLAKKKKA